MRRRASQRDSQAPPSCDSSPETPPCGPTHTCVPHPRWCCCSCSWLTVRNKKKDVCSHSRSASNVSTLGSLQSRLSVSEVFSWSVSFGTLLESVSGRRVFMEFLRSEHSDENMLFWLACQELQTQTHHSAIAETAKQIYLDYISILSPKEVSIDASVREAINRSMAAPTAHMFDEAQAQIHALMHRDSYPRFLSSSLYQSLLHGAPAAAPTSIH